MQINSLRTKSYKSWAVNDTITPEGAERLKKIELFQRLRSEGCSEKLALQAIGWSRATYFRWKRRLERSGTSGLVSASRRPRHVRSSGWCRHHEQLVWKLRRENPAAGKEPIWRLLVREYGVELSVSTVGRILSKGVRLGRIRPCSFTYGRLQPKKRRSMKGHAKRWKYGMKGKSPGELVQIDHMSVAFAEGVEVKEFKAICPVSKVMVARAYSRATARNATRFLQALREDLPFPIQSIQVDGGSEFCAEFEEACEDLGIPLFVLPPRRPQFNGCVERANGVTRYQFYPLYDGPLDLRSINRALKAFQNRYNHYRPHRALDLQTPMEYLHRLDQAA